MDIQFRKYNYGSICENNETITSEVRSRALALLSPERFASKPWQEWKYLTHNVARPDIHCALVGFEWS